MQPRDWLQAGTAMFVGTLLFGMDLLARADIKKSKETLQNTYVEVKMVKVDVQEIKSDLKTIKSDVSTLKSDVSNLKSDLVTTRTEPISQTKFNTLAGWLAHLFRSSRIPEQTMWIPLPTVSWVVVKAVRRKVRRYSCCRVEVTNLSCKLWEKIFGMLSPRRGHRVRTTDVQRCVNNWEEI